MVGPGRRRSLHAPPPASPTSPGPTPTTPTPTPPVPIPAPAPRVACLPPLTATTAAATTYSPRAAPPARSADSDAIESRVKSAKAGPVRRAAGPPAPTSSGPAASRCGCDFDHTWYCQPPQGESWGASP